MHLASCLGNGVLTSYVELGVGIVIPLRLSDRMEHSFNLHTMKVGTANLSSTVIVKVIFVCSVIVRFGLF